MNLFHDKTALLLLNITIIVIYQIPVTNSRVINKNASVTYSPTYRNPNATINYEEIDIYRRNYVKQVKI